MLLSTYGITVASGRVTIVLDSSGASKFQDRFLIVAILLRVRLCVFPMISCMAPSLE